MNVKVSKSKIEGAGKGLFTSKPFKKGELIGLAHKDGQPVGDIGKMHNHSEEPTAFSVKLGNKRFIYANADLKPGEEITTDYRMQPELEQPDQFKKGGSIVKMPKKKNAKAYSRSIEATNRLFTENPLFEQPKSRKNKIYDPKAKYYQDGGSKLGPISLNSGKYAAKKYPFGKFSGVFKKQDGGSSTDSSNFTNDPQLYKLPNDRSRAFAKGNDGKWYEYKSYTAGFNQDGNRYTQGYFTEIDPSYDAEKYLTPNVIPMTTDEVSGIKMGVRQLPEVKIKDHNPKDSLFENIAEVVDPTGITSWDDFANARNEWYEAGTTLPSFSQTMDMVTAIPFIGKLGKLKYLASAPDALKATYKYFNLGKLLDDADSAQDIYNDNIKPEEKQNGGEPTTPEEWAEAIKAIEREIGHPDNWTYDDLSKIQGKLYDYKAWRENTPEGRAVIDYHNVPNEYEVPLPKQLNPAAVLQEGGESGYIELELSPEEIEEYKKGGYIVEEY